MPCRGEKLAGPNETTTTEMSLKSSCEKNCAIKEDGSGVDETTTFVVHSSYPRSTDVKEFKSKGGLFCAFRCWHRKKCPQLSN